ncbi:MAG: hypothetical protein HYX63_14770 [Gammaproteobacteria bacterium]|nr:hypothetical protein [Gammaproteobacteria bacterium]
MNALKTLRSFVSGIALSIGFLPALWSGVAEANLSGRLMSDFTSLPIATVQTATPIVMLSMSLDHQYWLKAYNDYTDLNRDGVIETTYTDTFEYYGYFHSHRCYNLDATKTFHAVAVTAGVNKHYCAGAWSGNFLNWATMTRMDIVRKILYGGYRSTDTATSTVLERAHLPGDAHSFAKYYDGADIASLTPYADVPSDRANGGNANGIDDLDEGITICNISYKRTGSSQGTTTATPTATPDPPPMMRVVQGNYQLWGASERRQCTWQSEFAGTVPGGVGNNSNNPARSGIFAAQGNPPVSVQLTSPVGDRDQIVRVAVCESTFFDATDDLENCSPYGNNKKPEGLLQRYGVDGRINFGLITGSYGKNISGGVLRKKIGSLVDPSSPEINVADGTFNNAVTTGIIKTLNNVRIWGYGYNNGTYLSGDSGGDNCTFQLTDLRVTTPPVNGPGEGRCASWGNPISEIYLETLRYLAIAGNSRSPTTAFDAVNTPNAQSGGARKDPDYITELGGDSWNPNPLTSSNFCASLNTIVFNASVNSYDDDQNTAADLPGTPDFISLTDKVGDGEAITGNKYFVGSITGGPNPGDQNGICTAKSVTGLGKAFGLCPEGPTQHGSYAMAGEAWWAHTNDIRPDLQGTQAVNTFAVSLATATPTITVPVNAVTGQVIRILPAYRLRKGGNNANEALNNSALDGAGALTDFKIVRPHTEVDPGNNAEPQPGSRIFSGKFYINWEDSQQGGDYDQDEWGTLEYRLDTTVSPAKLTVTTTAVAQSTINGQLFGFVISGSTQDGFHAYSGIKGGNYFAAAPTTDPSGVPGCNNCRAISEGGGQTGAQSYTFTAGADPSAKLLESPLFYAAKWGGFDTSKGDLTPSTNALWDTLDGKGRPVPGGDGIPDNFFFVTNPGALEAALTTIFDRIIERVSSGTAAAVVANDQQGTGAVFQAVYDPFKKDKNGEVKWIGTLHALWIDPRGFIREDSSIAGIKGKLDDYTIDPVVRIFFDTTLRRSRIERFSSSSPTTFTPSGSQIKELSDLQTIWNAREQLTNLSEATITSQRAFADPANLGRHILTWVDSNLNNFVDTGEVIDFVDTNFAGANFRWLDADTASAGQALVKWTRGLDTGLTQFRPRLLDYTGGGNEKNVNGDPAIMRLGDIINSTPVPVATPAEAFDLLAQDRTYGAFRERYRNRRQVVYIGGNDGMIHAFNGGFFDAATAQFNLRALPSGTEVQHPLGSEIWAYIPKNLLPHLQWSARKDYSHVYGVDATVRAFDAKVFTPDADHPNGWGTLLVAGMRFGGGADSNGIIIDTDGNPATTTDRVLTKSAYVVMDVTNPEKAPTVLAEISPPNLQMTTVFPQVATFQTPNGNTVNKWYLVFGSGPTELADASYKSGTAPSQKFAQVFAYDLADLRNPATGGLVKTFTLTTPDVFIGDPVVSDYNINMMAEAIYFGTVGNPSDTATNKGGLFRISLGEKSDPTKWTMGTILSGVNLPFVSQPAIATDEQFNRWVIAGSGRFLANADKSTNTTQTMFGFIDPNKDIGSVASLAEPTVVARAGNGLIDVTKYRVFSNGDVSTTGGTTPDASFKGIVSSITAAGGWKRDYANQATPVDTPAGRSVNRATVIDSVVFGTEFTPSTDLCGAEGTSKLLGLFFKSGTTTPTGIFGQQPCPANSCPTGVTESIPSVDLGAGLASTPSIHIGKQDVPGKVTAVTQSSTGAINTTNATTLGGIKNGEISWREYRGN